MDAWHDAAPRGDSFHGVGARLGWQILRTMERSVIRERARNSTYKMFGTLHFVYFHITIILYIKK